MPLSYVISKEHRLVVVTGVGRITFGDLRALLEEGLNDPDFCPDFNELVDLRAVAEIAVTGDETRTLARVQTYSRNARRAFVASNPNIFGMSRMWEAYTEISKNPAPLRVFHDLDSAVKWLGFDILPAGLLSGR